jgi:hypothetical protein
MSAGSRQLVCTAGQPHPGSAGTANRTEQNALAGMGMVMVGHGQLEGMVNDHSQIFFISLPLLP